MEEAINAWEKDRDTAQKWVKCHIKSILHPKMLQIGTFNDLFQLIIYKFINYQSKWCSVHSAHKSTSPPRCPGRSSRWCFLIQPTKSTPNSNDMATPKLLRLKNGTKTKIQIYFLIFIVGPSLAPRSHFSKDILRGKRMHGMGNGTVVLKHNANLKVYIHQSHHLLVTASLSIYVWYNKNHVSIHYWSQQLVLKLGPKMDPYTIQRTNPAQTPGMEEAPQQQLNLLQCKLIKKNSWWIAWKLFKKSSCYENLRLVKSLFLSIIYGLNQLSKCSRFSRHNAVFLTPQKIRQPPRRHL